ncbi:MAG: apolipoprotein N-acyltransferase [Planctomycetota bacterium]
MKPIARDWGLILLSAAMYAAAFPPIYAWWLAPFALVPFGVAVHRASTRGAVVRTYVFALLSWVFGVHWLWSVSPLALVAAPPFAAAWWVIPGVAVVLWNRRWGWPWMVGLPIAWLLNEWFRYHPLNFPFLYWGSAFGAVPRLAQAVDITGVSLLTALCAATSGWCVDRWAARQGWAGAPATRTLRIGGGVVIAGWCFVVFYGFAAWTDPQPTGPVIVGVQGNVPQHVKQAQGTESLYDKHVRLTVEGAAAARAAGLEPDLYGWAETMAPWISALPGTVRDLGRLSGELDAPLFVGSIGSASFDEPPQRRKWNSGYLFRPDGSVPYRHDKSKLVPATEWLPLQDVFPVLGLIMQKLAGWAPDFQLAPLPPAFEVAATDRRAAWRAGPQVCYEIVYPEVSLRQARDGADLFLNITNEAWFPGSAELPHMWQAAVIRAIETRTPVVRVANSGISGAIDPNGVDLVRLEEDAGGSAGASFHVQVPQYDRTTLYERLGDWLGTLGMIVGLGAFAAVCWPVRRRREDAPQTP